MAVKSFVVFFDIVEVFQAKVIRHLALDAGDEKEEVRRQLEAEASTVKEVATACDAKRSK